MGAEPENLTTVLLIRHTEVHNPDDILYGRMLRFHLTARGFSQAEATAEALATTPVGAFYVSPRLRARQTAHIIAFFHPGVPVHTSRLIDEVLTAWQGRPHSHLEANRFDYYGHPLADTDESLEDLARRVRRFVALARRRHPGATIAAITHGDPVMVARAIYLRMPLNIDSLRLPNVYAGHGSITRLSFGRNLKETYPVSVEYWDPNSDGQAWSKGYIGLEPGVGLKENAILPAAG